MTLKLPIWEILRCRENPSFWGFQRKFLSIYRSGQAGKVINYERLNDRDQLEQALSGNCGFPLEQNKLYKGGIEQPIEPGQLVFKVCQYFYQPLFSTTWPLMYVVTVRPLERLADCSCKAYRMTGDVCQHILSVLYYEYERMWPPLELAAKQRQQANSDDQPANLKVDMDAQGISNLLVKQIEECLTQIASQDRQEIAARTRLTLARFGLDPVGLPQKEA